MRREERKNLQLIKIIKSNLLPPPSFPRKSQFLTYHTRIFICWAGRITEFKPHYCRTMTHNTHTPNMQPYTLTHLHSYTHTCTHLHTFIHKKSYAYSHTHLHFTFAFEGGSKWPPVNEEIHSWFRYSESNTSHQIMPRRLRTILKMLMFYEQQSHHSWSTSSTLLSRQCWALAWDRRSPGHVPRLCEMWEGWTMTS